MKAWNELHLGEEALGGLAAGIVGTVIGFPLDLIKTRMQTTTGSSNINNSIVGVATAVVRHEGVLALYKGVAPPLLSLSILNTLNFVSYSFFRSLYKAEKGWNVNNGLAGLSVGPLAATVSTVENLVKTQLQLDNVQRRQYQGARHCVALLWRTHGPAVFYKGHAINTARESLFLATYFFVYEGLRQYTTTQLGTTAVAIPMAGGLAGALAWFVSFPLDCIRAGVQGANLNLNNNHKNAPRVFRDLMKSRGLAGLYSGVAPSIARAFLVSGSRFSAYEAALWLLRGGREIHNH